MQCVRILQSTDTHLFSGPQGALRGGARLMCTPETFMQFMPRHPGLAIDDRPSGYPVIDPMDDGRIATAVLWLEGYLR